MNVASLLQGKKILVVDDEPDILETLAELLETCSTEIVQDLTKPWCVPGKSWQASCNRCEIDYAIFG